MPYQPKIITGKVSGTGWPIDGHVLYFSLWDNDHHGCYHLYGWEDEDDGVDEAVMLTMYHTEVECGIFSGTQEEFAEKWKAKEWRSSAPFCLPLSNVEELEVKQEEERDEARDRLLAHGIDLNRGDIICLPMEKNLNGDIKAKHPDWELTECPHCGRSCWKSAEADRLVKEQGAQLLCTECALSAGLVRPYRPDNAPKPGGNREQRRRAKRGRKER